MLEIKGTLIPIGGNEDKGIEDNELYTLEFIEDGILFHVVKEAGGTDSKIVVIPTASNIPNKVGRNYVDAFTKLGCKDVHVFNVCRGPRFRCQRPKGWKWRTTDARRRVHRRCRRALDSEGSPARR